MRRQLGYAMKVTIHLHLKLLRSRIMERNMSIRLSGA